MKPTREHIVDEATTLFKKLGFKSISMDAISASLGISKKTLYAQFVSKEGLIRECVITIFKQHKDFRDETLAKGVNPIQKIVLLYRYGFEHLSNYSSSYYYELKKYYPEIHRYYNEARESVLLNTIVTLMKQAQQQGLIMKEFDIALFLKLHLHKIDALLSDRSLTETYTLKQLLDHLIVYTIKGVMTQEANQLEL